MSSKKTTHYKLHQWEPSDHFLRTEFNDNFTAIDGALRTLNTTLGEKAEIVMGSYTGDGTDTRKINLGFTPRLVFVISEYADLHGGSYYYGGLALKDQPTKAVTVTEGGFTVRYNTDNNYVLYSNGERYKYFYWALR